MSGEAAIDWRGPVTWARAGTSDIAKAEGVTGEVYRCPTARGETPEHCWYYVLNEVRGDSCLAARIGSGFTTSRKQAKAAVEALARQMPW